MNTENQADKNNKGFTFSSDCYYVVNYDVAASMPAIFDPNAKLPKRALIISMIYQRNGHMLHSKTNDVGESAAELSRLIDEVVATGQKSQLNGNAYKYVLNNGKLTVIIDGEDHGSLVPKNICGENIIDTIGLAVHWNTIVPETTGKVFVLSNDPDSRIAAQSKESVNIINYNPHIYTGWKDYSRRGEICDVWRKGKKLTLDNYRTLVGDNDITPEPNEFFLFAPREITDFSMLGRYDKEKEAILPLQWYDKLHYTQAKNPFQAFILDGIVAPTTINHSCIIIGPAGSGKTRLTAGAMYELTPSLRKAEYAKDDKDKRDKNGKKRNNSRSDDVPYPDLPFDITEGDDAVDIYGLPRNRKKTPAATYVSDRLTEEDKNAIRLTQYRNVFLIPADKMFVEKLTVPGDERKKYANLLMMYEDNFAATIQESGDKLPGGRIMTDDDIYAKAKSIVGRVKVLPMSDTNGRSIRDGMIGCDEGEFRRLAWHNAILGRIDVGTKGIFSGDPTQLNNRYGWRGNSLVRFSDEHKSDDGIAIIWIPYVSDFIYRPGGLATIRHFDEDLRLEIYE